MAKKNEKYSGLGADIDINIALVSAQKALLKAMEEKKTPEIIMYGQGMVFAYEDALRIVQASQKKKG